MEAVWITPCSRTICTVRSTARIGKRLRFQGGEFEGGEECKACYWTDEAVAPGTGEFLKAACRGGLRARIPTNGMLNAVSK